MIKLFDGVVENRKYHHKKRAAFAALKWLHHSKNIFYYRYNSSDCDQYAH